MKKVINRVDHIVDEALDGMALAFPSYLRRVPGTHVLARAVPKRSGRVGLVSGGGSGHEPAHGGYVGYGMLDAAVAGEVFTSPTPDQVLEGIRAADGGSGVLLIIKNYTGDVMNFDIARELAQSEGIMVHSVTVNDDVAVEDSLYTTGRRGIAGTVYVHKIAGALAERGASLAEVKAVAESVISRTRSMGFALTSCTVPANGAPTFMLEEHELEMGIGIHGEPGIRREPVRQADELARFILDRLSKDLDLKGPMRLAALVNGMGGTPMLELAILARTVAHWCQDEGHELRRVWMGEYMTSLEMQGASLSLLSLDERLQDLLDAPADTPALRQGVSHD